MPVIKFTVTQIEKMLVTKARDAADTLGVDEIIDPDKGFTVRTRWQHKDSEGDSSTASEHFNPYRSYIEIELEERY